MLHLRHIFLSHPLYTFKKKWRNATMTKRIYAHIIRYLFLILFIFLMMSQKFQVWLLVYLIGVVLSFFFWRIYCGYVCPMNTLMRPIQHVSQKIGLQRKKHPAWLEHSRMPFLILIISITSMIMGKRLFNKNIPILLILFILSLVVTLFFKSPVWHNGLCPYSILLRIGGKISRRSKNVHQDECIGCTKCMKVCPAGAIFMNEKTHKAEIQPSLCHQCELCSDVCPTHTISYTS